MITIICQCGETYHAEERHEGSNIKCTKCGNILLIRKLGAPPPVQRTAGPLQERRESTSVGPQTKSGPQAKRWWQKNLYLWIGTAVVWGIILFLALPEHKAPIKTPPVAPPSPARTSTALTPIEKPQKEELHPPLAPIKPIKINPNKFTPIEPIEPKNPKRLPLGSSPFGIGTFSGHSTLTVDNGTDIDAVVKVIRVRGRQHIRNFYIYQGRKWTAKEIPPGQYVLRVAFGRDWNSKSRKFNFRRSFSETEIFDISETTSVRQTDDGQLTQTKFTEMRITLHKVLMGNFKSHDINEEDFDQ